MPPILSDLKKISLVVTYNFLLVSSYLPTVSTAGLLNVTFVYLNNCTTIKLPPISNSVKFSISFIGTVATVLSAAVIVNFENFFRAI